MSNDVKFSVPIVRATSMRVLHPRIGPVKPPPPSVIHALLYVAWIAVTGVFAAILAGAMF